MNDCPRPPVASSFHGRPEPAKPQRCEGEHGTWGNAAPSEQRSTGWRSIRRRRACSTWEQVADLASRALADAGLRADDIDGLVINGPQFHEASVFVPAMAAEYLGLNLNFAEVNSDLGWLHLGGHGGAPRWPSRWACAVVCCACCPPAWRPFGPDEDPTWMARAMRYGGYSTAFGAPEAEFDLPYGHMGQNTGYAMIAQRYAAQYGYDPLAMIKIAVDQRTNALANPRTRCSSASPSPWRRCWPARWWPTRCTCWRS